MYHPRFTVMLPMGAVFNIENIVTAETRGSFNNHILCIVKMNYIIVRYYIRCFFSDFFIQSRLDMDTYTWGYFSALFFRYMNLNKNLFLMTRGISTFFIYLFFKNIICQVACRSIIVCYFYPHEATYFFFIILFS